MKLFAFVFVIFMFLGGGCSQTSPRSSTSSQTKKTVVSEEIKDKRETVKEATPSVNYGPSQRSQYFIDVTEKYGLKGLQAVYLSLQDMNFDGHTDLVLLESHFDHPKTFLYHKKKKKFLPSPINHFPSIERYNYFVMTDFDKDGIHDFLGATFNQGNELAGQKMHLFKGVKNKEGYLVFKTIAESFKYGPYPSSSMAVFDYNLDGFLDLYIGNWYESQGSAKAVVDRLMRGEAFLFQDDSARLEGEGIFDRDNSVFANSRPTRSVSLCDVDRNGRPDILVGTSNGQANKLWLNILKGDQQISFRDYAKESGLAGERVRAGKFGGGNTFFHDCGDYNLDGIIDVMEGNLRRPFDDQESDWSAVLTGNNPFFPPRFLRTLDEKANVESDYFESFRRGFFFDLDLDGRDDLIIENSGFPPESRLIVYQQNPNHSFDAVAKKWGIDIVNPKGVNIFDLEKDGTPDIIVGQSNIRDKNLIPRIYLFKNQGAKNSNKRLKLTLRGIKSHPQAIGAIVHAHLKTGERVWRMNRMIGGAFPQQTEAGVWMGSGRDWPEKIVVIWPFLDQNGKNIRTSHPVFKSKKSFQELILCENGKTLRSHRANCL